MMSDLIAELDRLTALTRSWDANVGRKTQGQIPEALQKSKEEIERLRAENAKLLTLLQEHHDHHMNQGDIIYEDGNGGYGTFDGAEAYSDSGLGERTYEALPYPSDNPSVSAVNAAPDSQNTDNNAVPSTDGDDTERERARERQEHDDMVMGGGER